MKTKVALLTTGLLLLSGTVSVLAKEKQPKPGPLTGTWECMSHGSSQGDLPFTLTLEQLGETISGSVESPIGGTSITSGSFKKKALEIHIDTPQGNYLLTAKFNKGKLSGEWVHDPEKGTWEGSKQAAAAAK